MLPRFLTSFCFHWRDRRVRRVRKAERLPLQVRSFLSSAQAADDEDTRRQFKRMAWNLIHLQQRRLTGRDVRSKISQGRPLAKKQKLFVIEGIDLSTGGDPPAGTVVEDEVKAAVRGTFQARWLCGSSHRLELLGDFLAASPRQPVVWSWREFQRALNAIGKQYAMDARGECVAMWHYLFMAAPDIVLEYFGVLAVDWDAAAGCEFRAKALGKKGKYPRAGDIRVVIPLTARCQILDALFASRIAEAVAKVDTAGWFVAAVPHTQPLDVSFAISQMVERSCDDFSRGAWASMDIRAYYDNVDLLLVAEWIIAQNVPSCCRNVVAAAVAWQLLPSLLVDASITSLCIEKRTKGGLTGSRTAGAMGRVPVEVTMMRSSPEVQRWAYHLGTARGWSGASFVDNLYFFSHSL